MNKPNSPNSALKTPLNEILGSKGHVMVLRTLVDANSSLSHSELLDRTDLSRQGVYDVVGRLVETGILTYSGSGKQQQVRLRQEHPLSGVIIELFKSESNYFRSLIKKLHEAIRTLHEKPKSAWIFGKVAQGIDNYGDSIQIVVLGDVKSVDQTTESLRRHLYQTEIESKFDVTIDIRGITLADLESRPALIEDNIILLWGISPGSYLGNSNKSSRNRITHQEVDARSLTNAKAWTKLLKKYPEIIPRTAEYLANRIPTISSGEKKELEEWEHILRSMSYQRLKKFLESDSERSVRLRQSLPFWDILNSNEREELIKYQQKQISK